MEQDINLLETQKDILANETETLWFMSFCPSGFLFAHLLKYVALVIITP